MGYKICVCSFVLLLSGLLTSYPAIAASQQGQPPARGPANAESGQASDPDQDFQFAVQVQVVTLPVTVTDQKGQFVTDLDKKDFTILDNGTPQRIENFELSSEPLSLVVLMETSSRIQPLLPELNGAGILITQLILGESGEAAVLTFDREVKIAQDFTTSEDKIEAALRKLQTGGAQVRLSDAVGRAIFLLQQRPRGRRKVILIISEARDSGSSNKLGNVLRGAQQLGISVYTVGLSTFRSLVGRPADQNVPSSPYPPGVLSRPIPGNQLPTPDTQTNVGVANVNLLEIITDLVTYTKNLIVGNPLAVYAAGTGATDYPTDTKAKLEKALGRIGEELRDQYVITYRPNNLDSMGYHTIQVTLDRRDLEARFRPGYVMAPPAPASAASSRQAPPQTPGANPELEEGAGASDPQPK